MKLCGFDIEPGQKKEVYLSVNKTKKIKVILFCGKKRGRTLVVTAGVHGCEYNGIEALRKLNQELDPETLHGQVILVPLMNESGFYAGAKQIVPEDGVNLNRAFPGDAKGSLSAQIAFAAENYLYPQADLLVDLHGGDVQERAMSFVYFPAYAQEEITQKSRMAAQALSMPYRVASAAKNGLYSWASQCGVPALLLEKGGAGLWSKDEIDAYCQNIYELLAHLEILPQEFPLYAQQEITNAIYIEAEESGFWYPYVCEGESFAKGKVLGEMRALNGEVIRTYHAQFSGVTLYYTLALGVKTGDPLIAYGEC